MKNAFTLIELLVVIAIIAILAAILFPVFAQAKLAAKHTADLSNHKQLGLAAIMYTVDYDDYFPLAQTYNPNDSSFFGLDPWQVVVQPYIKNWGIFQNPLGPQIPTTPAYQQAWHQALEYGAPGRAGNIGKSNFQATNGLGSFDYRVCGNIPCNYDGIFGNGCAPTAGGNYNCPWYPGGNPEPSYSTTGIGSPASQVLITEGGMWDLWMNFGANNPCTYAVGWYPWQYSENPGTMYASACLNARYNAVAQTQDPADNTVCHPSNICDGVINYGIPNGISTYVATDGHAVAQQYRGGAMGTAMVNGTEVIKSLWPQGGF